MSSLSVSTTSHNSEPVKYINCSLTYTGTLAYCSYSIEKVSGLDVTHGGGVSMSTSLNYNLAETDNYSTSTMYVEFSSTGTGTYKIVGTLCTQENFNSWQTAYNTWADSYLEHTTVDGVPSATVKEGAPDAPTRTIETVKSNNITLVVE